MEPHPPVSLCFLYIFHPTGDCVSEQIPTTTPHRASEKKHSEPSEEVRIDVGVVGGAAFRKEGLLVSGPQRGDSRESKISF